MSKKLRVLLTGGGTGGHIYPIVAVARKLRDWARQNGVEADLRYYGQSGEYRQLLEESGIKVSGIAASKLRRYFSLLNFLDFFRFVFGFFQALWKLFWFMPDVAFSKGGPGALAVICAARFYLVPLVVHESDAVPGLTNRLSSRKAKVVDLAFNAAAERLPKIKASVHVVGQPLRPEVLESVSAAEAKKLFGFAPQKPLVLVLGGSQGSEALNDFVLTNLEKLLSRFQVLHLVGRQNYQEHKRQYEFTAKNFSPILKDNYKFADYLDKNIGAAMDAADLIISRAGAGAIFEIAAKGKPSIVVPFPEAAADHQRENAYIYAQAGAAAVIEQQNLLPSILIEQAEKILNNPEIYKKMSAAARDFAVPDAASKVATHILEQWQA